MQWRAREDTDRDGRDDTFIDVPATTPVCFQIVPVRHQDLVNTEEPLVYEALLTLRGDDAVLDWAHVFFIVPPN